MTKTYCDACGTEINLDGVPKPTHYSLILTHYDPSTAWDSTGPHWTHLCLACTASVKTVLVEWVATR